MKNFVRIAAFAGCVAALAFTSATSRAFTANNCASCSPSMSSGNGKTQNPEIIPIFWETDANREWEFSSQSPSRSQLFGVALSVTNSPYFAELKQYGQIGNPRLAPYAPILKGSPVGSPGVEPNPGQSFRQADVINVVNQEINYALIPPPQAGDDTIYVVFVPNSAQLSDSGCAGHNGCNFPGSIGGTSYMIALVGGLGMGNGSGDNMNLLTHEVSEAITQYQNVWVNNCGNADQIGDLCQCATEVYNGNWIEAYWSNYDQKCVIPEAYGSLYTNANRGGGWTEPLGAFHMRQVYGGGGGDVIATAAAENGGYGNNVYMFNGSTWNGNLFRCGTRFCYQDVAFGSGGATFAIGGGTVASIGLDPKVNGVFYYSIASGAWTGIGVPYDIPTSLTVTSNGIIVVSDSYGYPYYWNPASPGWHSFAGGGLYVADQYVASGGDILALTADHTAIYRWPASNFTGGGSWTYLGSHSPNLTQVVANSDVPMEYGAVFAGGNYWSYDGEFYSPDSTPGFQFAVTNTYNATDLMLDWNLFPHACYGVACGYSWYGLPGAGGRVISGTNLLYAGCDTNNNVWCVDL